MKKNDLIKALKDAGIKKTPKGCWLVSHGNVNDLRLMIHANKHGPLPTHSIVRMSCSRKKCAAPDHMQVNPSLTQRQIDEIRERAENGETIKGISEVYEVHAVVVRNIIRRTSAYKNL